MLLSCLFETHKKKALLVSFLCLCFVPAALRAQNTAAAPTVSNAQWQEDLRYMAGELQKRHKNIYHTVTRAQFAQAVARLDAAIPSLADHQIVVKMIQIAALVGDGHTGVHMPRYFKLYPLGLYWFGNELRVTGAPKEYERALGTKVVKIGELGLDEVMARVRTCFSSAASENEWYVLGTSPSFITRPEVLNALGIIPDVGHARFTFEDDEGKQFTLEMRPITPPAVVGGAITLPGMMPAAQQTPLWRQKPTEPFWFTYLSDSQTTYVNWRSYKSLGDNARQLWASIAANPTK